MSVKELQKLVSVGVIVVSVQGIGKADKLRPEGLRLRSLNNGSVEVIGADDSGVLYGCLELAEQTRNAGAVPANLNLTDAPEFKLRGPCIGMQRLEVDPYEGQTHPGDDRGGKLCNPRGHPC